MTRPDIWIHHGEVMVQFNERGPVFVLNEDGELDSQFTVPACAHRVYWAVPDPVVAVLPDNRSATQRRREATG